MKRFVSRPLALALFSISARINRFRIFQPHAQPLKKIRLASSSTNVSFLALYTALHRGFFKDEGIDLEIIFMPANLASTAVLNGDVDYNGAVTGTIGAAVQGRPMKVMLFTVAKPLLFLVSQKNIKDVKQLKGKKIAGSSPGGSATLLANQALKQIGLGARQRCFGIANVRQRRQPLRRVGIRRRRSVAALRAGKHHRH